MATLDVVLVLVMYGVDHPRLDARTHRQVIVLDVVHDDPAALRLDLEERLGGRVLRSIVTETDYVRDVTVVDVRYRLPAVTRSATVPRTRFPAGTRRRNPEAA